MDRAGEEEGHLLHGGPTSIVEKEEGQCYCCSERKQRLGHDGSTLEYDSLQGIMQKQRKFAEEREWNQYHTPRNLVMALVGEVGELAEVFQWRSDELAPPGLGTFSKEEREHLGEELSDVLLYLTRLADVCGIDMARAVKDKMEKNAAKYPANLCKGKSDKYTQYEAT